MRPKSLRFLITAGPCHEPIDQVRFLGNRSSGRMGIALADSACRLGHEVTLLLGPTPLLPSEQSIDLHRYASTAELQTLLDAEFGACDVLVMAAAVADFRPVGLAGTPNKIERSGGPLTITLEPTPDLVAGCAARKRTDQTVVAFALEAAESLRERARSKLERKNVDLIVANPLETMDSDTISAIILGRTGSAHACGTIAPAHMPKPAFADWLIEHIITHHTASANLSADDAIETQ